MTEETEVLPKETSLLFEKYSSWIFYQVERWGRRNGLPRSKYETSIEYTERLIAHLPEQEEKFNEQARSLRLSDLLRLLNVSYQSAYYGESGSGEGEHDPDGEYDNLLRRLKTVRAIR